MIIHWFEFFSKLNSLIKALSFTCFLTLDLDSSLFKNILELSHPLSILIELHVMFSLSESSDQLTAGFASSSKHLKYVYKIWLFENFIHVLAPYTYNK